MFASKEDPDDVNTITLSLGYTVSLEIEQIHIRSNSILREALLSAWHIDCCGRQLNVLLSKKMSL